MADETIRDFIHRTARLANILPQGQSLNAEAASDCLAALNDMIDEWNTERTNLYKVTENQLLLGSVKQEWQIGPGTIDFPSLPRPVYIDPESVAFISPDSTRRPVRVLTQAEWSQIPERLIQGRLVDKIYCDYAYPIATIQVC